MLISLSLCLRKHAGFSIPAIPTLSELFQITRLTGVPGTLHLVCRGLSPHLPPKGACLAGVRLLPQILDLKGSGE